TAAAGQEARQARRTRRERGQACAVTVTVVWSGRSRDDDPTAMVRAPVPSTQACVAEFHDERSCGVTWSVASTECPGSSVTWANWTRRWTACRIDAGRSGDGPM